MPPPSPRPGPLLWPPTGPPLSVFGPWSAPAPTARQGFMTSFLKAVPHLMQLVSLFASAVAFQRQPRPPAFSHSKAARHRTPRRGGPISSLVDARPDHKARPIVARARAGSCTRTAWLPGLREGELGPQSRAERAPSQGPPVGGETLSQNGHEHAGFWICASGQTRKSSQQRPGARRRQPPSEGLPAPSNPPSMPGE